MKCFWTKFCLAVVIVTPPACCLGRENAHAVQLQDVAEVNHATVVLSDLLPPGAPQTIRQASVTLELCPAPKPGSLRVLRSEQILASLTGRPDLARQIVVPKQVTIHYSGQPIREEAVRDAISEFVREHGSGSSLLDRARIDVPAFLVANEKSPQLQVTRLQMDLQQQAFDVRLRCANRQACGSFLVHVVLAQALPEPWRKDLIRSLFPNSAPTLGTAAAGPLLVARGKPATLILDDTTMRISVPVICLEPGLLNQRIRVFDQHSRRVFLAEVVGDHLLHAAL